MKWRKSFLALLIAGLFLLAEFKFIPLILKKWPQEFASPVEKEEKIKFELTSILKEADFQILLGPLTKKDFNGIEIIVLFNRYPLKIYFSAQGEPRSQVASLQLILKETKIVESFNQGEPPKLIDLTGDKPYVSF